MLACYLSLSFHWQKLNEGDRESLGNCTEKRHWQKLRAAYEWVTKPLGAFHSKRGRVSNDFHSCEKIVGSTTEVIRVWISLLFSSPSVWWWHLVCLLFDCLTSWFRWLYIVCRHLRLKSSSKKGLVLGSKWFSWFLGLELFFYLLRCYLLSSFGIKLVKFRFLFWSDNAVLVDPPNP